MNKKKIIIIISIIIIIIAIIILFILSNKDNKTYAVGDTLADVVMSLNPDKTDYTDTTLGSGVYYTNNHEYRYIGANVNNYVSFNNDLYRIIGVFDSNSHGQDGKMLVKLIRSRILGAYSWGNHNSSDTNGTYSGYSNDFTRGNLNILLNEYFYNKSDTSNNYDNCSTWTYYYNNTKYRTNDCSDIVGYGIDPSLQNYIEDATWYLYGYSGSGLSKQNFYLCERGGNSCTGANGTTEESKVKIQNKIGLMYVSDYMYASGYFNSTDTTTGTSSYYGNQNWLYKGVEWTITPPSNSSSFAFHVLGHGSVGSSSACNGFGARPTFYLKSSVYVTGGTGTFSDPYTISCDDCNV